MRPDHSGLLSGEAGRGVTIPETFLACPAGMVCYEAVRDQICKAFPEATVKVDRTQAAFRRGVQFAWLSAPRKMADRGAVVLSFSLPERVNSPRVFASVEPYPGRWMHHVLLRGPEELDLECLGWLAGAWAFASWRARR